MEILGVVGVSDGDPMGDIFKILEDLSLETLGDVSGREGDIMGDVVLLNILEARLEALGELVVDGGPASCKLLNTKRVGVSTSACCSRLQVQFFFMDYVKNQALH